MPYHKILKNQIEKLLPKEYAENEDLKPFLNSISNNYLTFERDKKLSEHAYQVSENEYLNATAQLEVANKELQSFSYSVAHDLRTPLRSLNGFSQILLEQYTGKLDDEAIRYLTKIKDSGLRMSELIDDLLQLSKISRHSAETKTVNLSTIVNIIVKEWSEFILPELMPICIIEENILAEGDEHLLTIALKNLLENAFKYTSKVNKPEISFGKINIDNESVYYIRDNGVGFNMQYADKLFQAFQRLHNSSDFSGTGIGLSIVNRIISKHSGRIWAESELNKNTTFYFTLNK
jgi:hypothetical protein